MESMLLKAPLLMVMIRVGPTLPREFLQLMELLERHTLVSGFL
ncbi:hypothetical protein PC116_g3683 [Phytophthora cactorum]|nr:hypothetical protein Pcac1_g14250 [Phytophthora cactorum]KAG2927534.1 hypothetical protein PC114_g3425 [Phytophthora cactorum]KAG4248577.1 hypothetical protein PC116_g3683 [Phytophthora cactorum]